MSNNQDWLQQLLERRQQQGKVRTQHVAATKVLKCSVCFDLVSELEPGHSWCKRCAASFDRIFERGSYGV